jgi:hypothetical protein
MGRPERRRQFEHITSTGTVTLKSSPGTLYAVLVNLKATAGAVLELFDSTTTTNAYAILGLDKDAISRSDTEVDFDNGITYRIASGSNIDVSLVYD